jgi:hypothetical protein
LLDSFEIDEPMNYLGHKRTPECSLDSEMVIVKPSFNDDEKLKKSRDYEFSFEIE